jgi:two-component system sensor histidine kinase GlrK
VRLAAKIFLASLLPLLVLMEVAGWSLNALDGVVQSHRGIVNQTLPALRDEAIAGESMASLVRLHGRWMLLRDPSYEQLWATRARLVEDSLLGISSALRSAEEQRVLYKTRRSFERYRDLASETIDGERRLRALVPSQMRLMRRAGERVARGINHLGSVIGERARQEQSAAAELEARTWRIVMLALPLSGLLAGVLSFLIAWRVTRMVRRLAAASSLLAHGALKEPVPVDSKDEIGQLARAFNTMAARLGELDRMKEQVYSHLAHELRTPLTSIREATHLLVDRVAGPLLPRQERLVTIINDSSQRLLRLVNRVLDVSRLRAGLQTFERRPVRLTAVTTRALRELRPQADAAGVHIDSVGNGSDPRVMGDEERLVEVVMNLVSNAIKASAAGGSVRVGVEQASTRVLLVVSDDGVGIPRDALARIFDPYVQAPGAPAGTGLGLAIVKSIVEAHGGEIAVESEPGRGSRFTVHLPELEAA